MGGAIGTNDWDKGSLLPIDWDIWWFFPNTAKQMNVKPDLWNKLNGYDINIIALKYDAAAAPFPKKQSKKHQNDEVEELEGDGNEAQKAVNDLFTPCPPVSVCYIPHW